MSNDLAEYFRRLTSERSIRALATRASLDPSTMNRQLSGKTALTIETVVAICRAYDLDFADVFVAVGFITEEEARSLSRRFSLSQISDRELSKEIIRRLNVGEATEEITDPIASDLIEEVLNEKRQPAPEDEIPYIGRVEPGDLPDKRAADKRPRVGDDEHAE